MVGVGLAVRLGSVVGCCFGEGEVMIGLTVEVGEGEGVGCGEVG